MEDKKFVLGLSRNVFFTGLVSLFMDISSEMVYPLIPLFLTGVLGATKTTVGIIEGIAEATASILKVFSGWLSDKLGKRKLLMTAGYGISAASRPLIAASGTWFEVLTARFIDRFGKGVRTAPRDAIIADSTQKEKLGLAYGFHRSMDTVGAVIGPVLAFMILFLSTNNLRLVFYASTIPAVIAVALILIFITEKKRAKGEAVPPKLSISSFNGPFRRYLVVIAIFSLGNFADAFLVLQAENLGVTRELIPVVYVAFNIVYALSSAPMGALADKIGLKNMILASFLLYSLIYLGVGFAASPVHIWILFPLYGIYKGMSEGTQKAYLAAIAPMEQKATAFGIYHTVSGVMLLPASIIAGYLWDNAGPGSTFLYGSAMSAAAAALFAFTGKSDRHIR
ncbi:MAG: MFS transporter [Deltaproteobacteria bacterium]|nr:MFS transporter [Deltaproteobacteria bacterium]